MNVIMSDSWFPWRSLKRSSKLRRSGAAGGSCGVLGRVSWSGRVGRGVLASVFHSRVGRGRGRPWGEYPLPWRPTRRGDCSQFEHWRPVYPGDCLGSHHRRPVYRGDCLQCQHWNSEYRRDCLRFHHWRPVYRGDRPRFQHWRRARPRDRPRLNWRPVRR